MKWKIFTKHLTLILICLMLTLIITNSSSADTQAGGTNLTTVETGIVSGGLYSDSYYGYNNSENPKDVTYTFKDLPENAQIVSATLYTAVYLGNQREDRPVNMTVNFNGQLIATEYLSSTYTWPGEGGTGTVWLNDHCNRVTSDYLLWYDVTSLIQQSNTVQVNTNLPSTYDGRIKLITLVVAYNDGDSDIIRYWINQGHDTSTYNDDPYIGRTTFNSNLPSGSTIEESALQVIYLASQDGIYTFNNNIISAGTPQGNYAGGNSWDVTNIFENGMNTLTYDRTGNFYKIVLSLLTVQYQEPIIQQADMYVTNFITPSTAYLNQNYLLTSTITNGGLANAGSFQVKLYDNNQEIATQTINSLATGASTTLNWTWTPTTSGQHTLNIQIDPQNQINETNETNNEFQQILSVEVPRPDLVVEGWATPENMLVNHPYQLQVTITNGGLANAGSFQVKLYDNNQEIATQTINSLATGASTTLNWTWTPTTSGQHTLNIQIDPQNQINETNETNNQGSQLIIIKDSQLISVFLISDQPGTNILNQAAHDILNQYGNVSLQIRTNQQIENMSNADLLQYLQNCDIFIAEWISSDVAGKLLQILTQNPNITQDKVFLLLEPPISTTADSVKLLKYNTINNVKILDGFTNNQLQAYYQNTKRGTDYQQVLNYLNTVNFPAAFELATLYKDLNDKINLKNQILWALSLMGMSVAYQEPQYYSGKQDYGIYRYRWYVKQDPDSGEYVMDLEGYMNEYFTPGKPVIGLIESTMYVESQQLQPYYAIIDALEEKGMNVIPVMAYGGSSAQLDIMVKAFTSAPDYASFIAHPEQYDVYVDAIVEMPAYGLGGDNFTEVVNFFTTLNVPVIRALHSDNYSNEEWELSTTGLPTTGGDKWWHVSILEAQGIIMYTFVGGQSVIIDPETGASIMGYVPQMDNINLMAQRIKSWTDLQYLDNSQKKVALIYYNYPPGKDNIGSSYLDTITSIYNLLNILKENGYDVNNIPPDTQALLDKIIGNKEKNIPPLGINVANWAPGVLEELANNPQVILYPVADYMVWFSSLDEMTQLQVTQGPVAYIGELCKKAVELNYTEDMESRLNNWYSGMLGLLPDDKLGQALPLLDNIKLSLNNYINTGNIADYNQYLNYKTQFLALNIEGMGGWGEPPGNIMVVNKNGVDYFVIPGMWFGNVFIGPEPQRGWEADINQLYHSTVVAPPHQYLAYYAYLQSVGTNAMVFLGRHATHEWLPGKEVILSSNDFPSIVTGTVPQIYFYEVDGLAEGIQAKRRGSAVIITHLTPPLTFTELYGGLGSLAQLVDEYENADASQKNEIITQIKKVIQDNNYNLGVDVNNVSDDKLVEAVDNYLNNMQSTLYPYGLHAIGQAWSEDEIALLVSSMLSVPFDTSQGGDTTTLQDEIAHILFNKPYADLSALDKSTVQNKCLEIIKDLINSDPLAVANSLVTNPEENLILSLELAKDYVELINLSVENEVSSFLNALNGGYIPPGAGGDPVNNPEVLPTGTNFFDDQSAEIPTKKAYEYARTLALLTLEDLTDDTEKIAVGVWCVETARDDGALVAMILYLLGMEPQWTDSPSAGVGGQKLKEIPKYVELEDLVRPEGWDKKRIDVVIITSGLFRDLYSRQAILLDNAFRVALARSYYTIINDPVLKAQYGDKITSAINTVMTPIGYYGVGEESLADNYVAQHWVEDFKYYLSKGYSPEEAGEMAITRIFAPPEGDYGAGISKATSMSWTWKERMELAQNYLQRMANMYSNTNWGANNVEVFTRLLEGIDTVFTSRNTNLYGVLDNDDFFDYWGGLSLAMEYVNGNAPNMFVLSYANRANPQSISFEQFMNQEMVSRYFNPNWIQGMMGEGYSGARYMSKKFVSNLWGWQVTRPNSVENWMWDEIVDVYLNDKYNLGVTDFLTSGSNSYAMISMTGTLLTAAYEGYWQTDQATLQQVANMYAQMITQNGVACCDCSCGNIAMMKWATQYINADLLSQFNSQVFAATQSSSFAPSPDTPHPPSNDGSTSNNGQTGSTSPSTASASSVGTEGESDQAGPSSSGGSSGKSYELNPENSSSSSPSGMPIVAIAGIILLIALVGVGYFRDNISGLLKR